MATPLFSIGGLASGLDTTSIISQLMQLERQPVVRFQQRQAELRKVDDAWGQVTTKLSAVRTALGKVGDTAGFDKMMTLTSSQPDAVAVTSSGTPTTGSFSFSVTALAAAHQTSASFTAPDAAFGDGTLTVGSGTDALTVETTGKTVAEVARELNAQDGPVTAQVIQIEPGRHDLLLTARATGTANALTLGGSGEGRFTTRQAAADAQLVIGSGPDAVTLTRSSNALTDVVPGMSIDLRRAGTGPVTVTAARDVDAGVTAVKGLIDAVNGALSTLKSLTAYNAETETSGLLQGDPVARQLMIDLRAAVSAPVGGLSPGQAGVGLDRFGAVTLDEARLRTALEDDPDAVARLFARSTTVTEPSRVDTSVATDETAPGTYGIEVLSPARSASVTGASYVPPLGSTTFTITSGGTAVSVTLDPTDADAASAVARITAALEAAAVTSLTASVDGDRVRLDERRPGTGASFTVAGSADLGLDGTHAGADVAGHFVGADGTVLAAAGIGDVLTGLAGTAAKGLAVTIGDDLLGDHGDVRVIGGLSGALGAVLARAEGATGSIQRARDSLTGEIDRFDDQIAAYEVRLEGREATLRKKYAALEVALANAQSQGQWLAGQLGQSQA